MGLKIHQADQAFTAQNFQAITWAQQNAGYLDASGTPNASLESAFHAADAGLKGFP